MLQSLPSFESFRSVLIIYALPVWFLYLCIRSVYRITFHSLAKVPGPKIAAITRLYEIYWESIRPGQFSNQIERLHQQYGPIIRISPSQLHIMDPAFYDQLYNFSKYIDRPQATIDNLQHSASFEIHRVRRKALGGSFTRTAISQYEDLIQSNVDLLCTRMKEAHKRGDVINFSLLFRCLTSDIILELTFGEPYGFLEDPVKSEVFFKGQNSIFKHIYLFTHYKAAHFFLMGAAMLPQRIVGPLGSMVMFISDGLQRLDRLKKQGMGSKSDKEHRQNLVEVYATDEDLPPSEKTDMKLLDLALLFLSAGFETTGYALESAFFHLLTNPEMLERLRAEIQSTCPKSTYKPEDRLPLSQLEKLPYLTAIIDETLRLSIGVMARLPRINSHSDMTYNGFTIPKGTPVSMSQRFIHYSPEIYPEPTKFDPERWLQGPESQELRKHWMPFSRGARVCIGMNLAYAELYITIATLIHREFKFELYNTTRAEVDPAIDFFIPKPLSDKGVRVKMA